MNHGRQIRLLLFFTVLVFHSCAAAPKSSQTVGSVEVTVVSTNDMKPLRDASIVAQPNICANHPLPGWTGNTSSDGKALLRLPAGTYGLSISKRDWLPTVCLVSVTNGRTSHVSAHLIPAPRITGTVHDPSGAPAASVLVSFHPGQYPNAPEYGEVETGANGQYELVLQQKPGFFVWVGPINMTNFILARNLVRNLVAIQEFATASDLTNLWKSKPLPTKIDLTLQPGITLSGSVEDAQGAPITNAAVDLRTLSGNSIVEVEPKPLLAHAKGLFSCSALPPGRDYFVEGINAKGYGSAYANLPATNAHVGHYTFPPFILKRADRKLAGRVLADGKPLAGADVFFSGPGQPQNSRTNTDANGNFAFDEVWDGRLKIFASYVDLEDTTTHMNLNGGDGIEARPGDTNILIQLHDPNAGNWVLTEEISKASKIDLKLSILPLTELLRLYEEKLSQYADKTAATRKSILKIFKATWKSGLDVPIKSVSAGQIELWLVSRKSPSQAGPLQQFNSTMCRPRHSMEQHATSFRPSTAWPLALTESSS